MNETKELARFACDLTYDALPSEVREKVKHCVLDQMGCQIAFATLPWSKSIYRAIRPLGGAPESTVAYYGYRTSADNAAFLNGSFGHGYEFDDTYFKRGTHPGVVIIPAALAMGEREAIDGKTFVTAVTIGYEIMVRLTAAINPYSHFRGHHSPPGVGPFGAAAATGKIIGLDFDQMVNALGIAGSHAAGVREYTHTGGETKRIHAGLPAHSGIRSALLAQAGLTGPPTVIEGKWGFLRVWADQQDFDIVTRGLGKDWEMLLTGIKPHCCNGGIHPFIDSLQHLRRQMGFGPDDVQQVVVTTSAYGKNVFGIMRRPENILGAQFSAPFSLATTLLRGSNGFGDYQEQFLTDPRFLEMADRVVLETEEEFDQQQLIGNLWAGKLKVVLKDGQSEEVRTTHPRGYPENPMTWEEVQDKFRTLARTALSDAQVERIIETVEGLDDLRAVRSLAALTVA
ncbi:MAG: MmgE/PrpD family protein [Chloroflexi bacterium]|nr:MmgE/PrpD family protein [Chloroflexota bacterium]